MEVRKRGREGGRGGQASEGCEMEMWKRKGEVRWEVKEDRCLGSDKGEVRGFEGEVCVGMR